MSEKPIVEIVPIESLQPDPNNANRGTERGYYMLTDSVQERGAARSIWATSDGVVKGGNKTHRAAIDVGIEEAILVHSDGSRLVVVVRDDLVQGDPVADRLAIEDNRIGQASLEFDPAILLEMGKEDATLTDGLWRDDEWEELLGDLFEPPDDEPPPLAQMDKGEELAQKYGTATGQIWELGEHRLAVGDCTDAAVVERVMDGELAVLCHADPPYGIGASNMTMGKAQSSLPKEERLSHGQIWDDERPDVLWLLQSARWTCVWGGNCFADIFPVTNDWLCWHKKNDERSFSEFELAWTNYGKQTRHLSHHWGGETKEHITQKPLPVIQWAIERCPDASGLVFDPYAGSGTTLIAAHRLGRKCYTVEISPGYAAVSIQRWVDLTGLEPIRIESQ